MAREGAADEEEVDLARAPRCLTQRGRSHRTPPPALAKSPAGRPLPTVVPRTVSATRARGRNDHRRYVPNFQVVDVFPSGSCESETRRRVMNSTLVTKVRTGIISVIHLSGDR